MWSPHCGPWCSSQLWLLLGRARLFVSPQQQQQAPTTEKLDTQTGREVIVFGFKKYFQIIEFENIIMKSVDMKFSLEQLLQGAGQCLQIFIYHILICQNSD